ncbi:secreted protein [Candidatus Magnetobacterium bavaricum]|uniref:Secreted protein n=1 Tax=Candidatus Magnetobacterium bavaricum TaxID=29290 RepID=A0A0F3H056_9BACT|nr:secreted protein [Candidatus Magnetobacterium bavaricum]
MLLLVALFGVSMWSGNVSTVGAADGVTYTLPYLHTSSDTSANGSRAVYCILSNMSSDNATVSFQQRTNASTSGLTPAAAAGSYTLVPGTSPMITISSTSVAVGTSSITSVTSDGNYGGYLILAGPSTSGATPISCETVGMACFQGATNPKRNLVGYQCRQSITGTGVSANGTVGGATDVYTY